MKHKIRTSFDRAGNSYDEAAELQRQVADTLVNLYEKYSNIVPKSILDLGTGTGYVPELLLKIFPKSHYTLNDISPNMLQRAKEKLGPNSRFSFILSDMENFNPNEQYNLIISNLALQWVNNLENTIFKFYQRADIFAFSYLLKGTFCEWEDLFTSKNLQSPTKNYHTEDELTNWLTNIQPAKLHFKVKDFYMEFVTPYAFMKSLKKLGANSSSAKIPFKSLREIVADNNKFGVTYKIFFCIMLKP